MKTVYNVQFINTLGKEDGTQLNAENREELNALIEMMRDELKLDHITDIEEIGKVRYYVSLVTYGHNDEVTDYDADFGDFDTYEEAYECFVKTQCLDKKELFYKVPRKVAYGILQLEECEETEEMIECIDVLNESTIERR